MAASYHVRSNSLPSRPNRVSVKVDEQLSRLRCSESASTSSSISQKLNNLQDLHVCIEKLLQLPITQQAVSQEQNKKMVEELLDGSLRLLDVCNISKDALSLTKESLNEIQSLMHRKRGDFFNEVKKYLASRKSLKKTFQKVLKSLKTTDDKYNGDETLVMLKQAEEVTTAVFDSLLCFIYGSKLQLKTCRKWSLVSKMMNKKRTACEQEEADANEFARVDASMKLLIEEKSEKTMKMEDVQNLETCIQDLEEGLDSLFRSLIKVRVSVLNILGH